MTDNIENVIRRIQLIINLAGNNPSEEEIAAANDKVHALLAKYQLTLADVEVKKADEDPIGLNTGYETNAEPWRYNLGTMIGKMYFCRYFYTTQNIKGMKSNSKPYVIKRVDRHSFVGTKANTIIACLMFKYLTENIDRLAKAGATTVALEERSPYRVSFRHSAVSRLCWRIQARLDKAQAGELKDEETGTNMLALLNLYDQSKQRVQAFMDSSGIELKKHVVKSNAGLHDKGQHDGDKAGREMGLDQQISHNTQAKLT